MKNSQKGFTIPLIIAIIAVLIIGGGTYAIMHNKQQPKEKVETIAQNSASTTDNTADWKTYRNEKYGFEFRYPSELSLDSDFPYTKEQPLYLWLQLTDLMSPMSPDCSTGIEFDLYKPNSSGLAQVKSAINVFVGGQVAKESHEVFDQVWDCKGQQENFETNFVHSGLRSVITLTGVAPISQESLGIYWEILSTFKFIDVR